MAREISSYGFDALDEMEKDRKDLRSGDLDIKMAQVRCTQANSTARLMGETLRSKKFETALKIS